MSQTLGQTPVRLGREGEAFAAFEEMAESQLDRLQIKLTYIGEQRKALPSLFFSSTTSPARDSQRACEQVLGMRVPGIDFGNDDMIPIHCAATPPELKALVRNLSLLTLTSTAASHARFDGTYSGTYLVLSLFNEVDAEAYRFQAVMGSLDAKPLLQAIGQALVANRPCRDALFILWRGLGFHVGVLDPDSDGDGASDGREASRGTDPLIADSDGDGMSDNEEILAQTDPLNPFHEPEPWPIRAVTEGSFKGSRVVELTTEPDRRSGRAVVEVVFTPDRFLPFTDNLVFLQVFRRTAVKADGVRIPILPSLYIEYAGSPELDQHTLDGATVDHKVGELDPFYNGRDQQDVFLGMPDRQHPGFIRRSPHGEGADDFFAIEANGHKIGATSMIYRCRTWEDHWRALNPEGVRSVQFDLETAAFCESGVGTGYFLGTLRWRWGKGRSEMVTAQIESAASVEGPPQGRVEVDDSGLRSTVPLFRQDDPGQPSRQYLDVLALWLRNHKYAWPGRSVSLRDGGSLTIPQPVEVDTRIDVRAVSGAPMDSRLAPRGLETLPVAREILGRAGSGEPFPSGYFPFRLPLEVTIAYRGEDVAGIDRRRLGVARFDPRLGRYTSQGLYILRKDPVKRTLTFCTSQFGTFALIGMR